MISWKEENEKKNEEMIFVYGYYYPHPHELPSLVS